MNNVKSKDREKKRNHQNKIIKIEIQIAIINTTIIMDLLQLSLLKDWPKEDTLMKKIAGAATQFMISGKQQTQRKSIVFFNINQTLTISCKILTLIHNTP